MLLDWLKKKFVSPGRGSMSPKYRKNRRLNEAFGINLDEGTKFDDDFFSRISGGSDLDIGPEILRAVQNTALLLYRKNPRANSYVEIIIDFCIGDGVSFKSADPRVQELLEEHWEVNEWDEKLDQRTRSLSIMGEQFLPTSVDQQSKILMVGGVSPLRVCAVHRDPGNPENLTQFEMQPRSHEDEGKKFNIINAAKLRQFKNDPKSVRWENCGFMISTNLLAGASRGYPDLGPTVDWLEGLDAFTFTLLERSELSMNIVYDLEYEGLNEAELKGKAEQFANNLSAGGINAHNEKSKTKIMSPELAAFEAKEIYEVMTRQLYAGTRFPGMFFGDSSDLTRASASELSIGASKKLAKRQTLLRRGLKKVFDAQICIGQADGRIPKDADTAYEIDFPQILLRDLVLISKTLNSLGDSLAEAETNGYISHSRGTQVYNSVLKELSAEDTIDVDDVIDMEKVDDEPLPPQLQKTVERATEVFRQHKGSRKKHKGKEVHESSLLIEG